MNANHSDIATRFEYTQTFWGEIIRGTKSEIQNLGIALGSVFPGEPEGPKRQLNVRDPRGFVTRIERWYVDDYYAAYITYPGRSRLPKEWCDFATGVRMSRTIWSDEYEGAAEDLIAAGLVRRDQLPGQPGAKRKRIATYRTDGSMLPAHIGAWLLHAGAKRIVRGMTKKYTVEVYVSEAERELRREAAARADAEHEAQMWVLPRPTPLTAAQANPVQRSVLYQVQDEARVLSAYRSMSDIDRTHILCFAQSMAARVRRTTAPTLRVIDCGRGGALQHIQKRQAPALRLVRGGAL